MHLCACINILGNHVFSLHLCVCAGGDMHTISHFPSQVLRVYGYVQGWRSLLCTCTADAQMHNVFTVQIHTYSHSSSWPLPTAVIHFVWWLALRGFLIVMTNWLPSNAEMGKASWSYRGNMRTYLTMCKGKQEQFDVFLFFLSFFTPPPRPALRSRKEKQERRHLRQNNVNCLDPPFLPRSPASKKALLIKRCTGYRIAHMPLIVSSVEICKKIFTSLQKWMAGWRPASCRGRSASQKPRPHLAQTGTLLGRLSCEKP